VERLWIATPQNLASPLANHWRIKFVVFAK